jgi:CheY-like chemotaxis protein
MLESAGFEVDVANDGYEGVQMATSRRYDAILMDLQMPGMDGFEATRRIRGHEGSLAGPGRSTPIIALTANATVDDRNASSAAGMTDFLAKPFSQDQLLAVLRHGLNESAEKTADDAGLASSVSSSTDVAEATVAQAVANSRALDYDAVLHRCMGKRELANRMIRKFAVGLEEEVTRIKGYLNEQDWAQAAQEAHKVKGSAAAIEATELRACLANLERNLRQGMAIDVDLVAAELERTASDYQDAARTILHGPDDQGDS